MCRSSFLNQGEICLCTSRVFVQRPVYDQFLARLVAAVAELAGAERQQSAMELACDPEDLAIIREVYGSRAQEPPPLPSKQPHACAHIYSYTCG